MNVRNINVIKKDIRNVDKILNNTKRLIEKHPNDFALKSDLSSFQILKKKLLKELSIANNNVGVTTFDLHITNELGGRITFDAFGKFADSFQDLVYSCAMFDGIHPVKKGSSLNEEIISNSSLEIVDIQAGSLTIYLSLKDNQTKLDDDTPLKKSLEYINEMISCLDDKDSIHQMMKDVGNKPIYKYKRFLKVLDENKLNLNMYSSSTPKGFKEQYLSNDFAKKVYNVIDDSSYDKESFVTLKGELYSIDTHNNKCAIEIASGDLEEGKKIKFKFDDNFKHILKDSLEDMIKISLKRRITINPVEDTENEDFWLVKIL